MWEQAIDFFEDFCKEFDIKKEDDLKITLSHKYFHTYRVTTKINELLEFFNIPERTKDLARITALFHDIGRFVQLEKYKIYHDEKSHFDHGMESVKILKKENILEKLNINQKEIDAIYFAIENHNKYEIEQTKDELSLFLAKLIRDADKLVIMWEEPYLINASPAKISKNIEQDFLKHKLIKMSDVKNSTDGLVYYMAFAYGLNYLISLKILKKDELINQLLNLIEENDSKDTRILLETEINKFMKEGIVC